MIVFNLKVRLYILKERGFPAAQPFALCMSKPVLALPFVCKNLKKHIYATPPINITVTQTPSASKEACIIFYSLAPSLGCENVPSFCNSHPTNFIFAFTPWSVDVDVLKPRLTGRRAALGPTHTHTHAASYDIDTAAGCGGGSDQRES